jgi:hypothetical protein
MRRHETNLQYAEPLIRSCVESRKGPEGIVPDYDAQSNPEFIDIDKVRAYPRTVGDCPLFGVRSIVLRND